MKIFKILLIMIFSTTTLVFAQLPNINDAKKAAKSAVNNAGGATYLAAKAAFKKVVKDIPFEFNSYQIPLHNPHYSIKGYDVDKFMKEVLIPALSNLVNSLPTDKSVLIIGHASSVGSEEATDDFMGNIALSKKRAESVLEYILNNSKLSRAKFKIVAKGSSSPLSGISPSSTENCRVSLDIQ